MENETELFEFFNRNILDAGKTITVTSISSEYNMDLKKCAEILEKWVNNRKENEFSIEFLVSGLKTNKEIFIAAIKSEDFEKLKSQTTIFEKTLFSVRKSANGPCLEALNLTDLKYKTNCRYKFYKERSPLLKTKTEEEVEKKCIQRSDIKNENDKKKPLESSTKFEQHKKEKSKTSSEENIQKSKILKSGGANQKTFSIASFFTAKPTDNKNEKNLKNVQVETKNSSSSKPSTANDEDSQKKTKRNPEDNLEQLNIIFLHQFKFYNNLEENNTETSAKRRKLSERKRIFVESSEEESSSSEEENSSSEDQSVSKENEDDPRERIVVFESDFSNSIGELPNVDKKPSTSVNKNDNNTGRNTEKEIITYVDDEGYLVTMIRDKTEAKSVTIPEKKPSPPSKNAQRSSPRKPGKTATKPIGQQISIADFFAKKN